MRIAVSHHARNNKISLDDTAFAALLQILSNWWDPVKRKHVDVAIGGGFDICGELPSKAAIEVPFGDHAIYEQLANFPDEQFSSPPMCPRVSLASFRRSL